MVKGIPLLIEGFQKYSVQAVSYGDDGSLGVGYLGLGKLLCDKNSGWPYNIDHTVDLGSCLRYTASSFCGMESTRIIIFNRSSCKMLNILPLELP